MIGEAWCLHFGTFECYFGISGAPWATLGAAGRMWGSGAASLQFWHDFGIPFEISGTEGSKSGVISGFVSMSLLTPISRSKSGHLGLPKRGFRIGGIAKTNFSTKSEF